MRPMADHEAILDDLHDRGLIQDHTDLDLLRARLAEGPITLYAGFDPTADSLHIGHLVPLLLLHRFQRYGHRPIALAGGATGMIGDPGGRSEERNLLDDATVSRNVRSISAQLAHFLDFESAENPARLVDNRDWTASLTVVDFLRDIGKHVTVNVMLAKESVRSRVEGEHGISYTEFSYMLLQANDFWWLRDHMGCELQVGGSDQWGNITAGVDLIRRRDGTHVHALTVPLVTRSDGTKFGKTAVGAVWLDPERTSPYELYQYFLQVDDRDAERFLLQLTLEPVPEIREVMATHRDAPERRVAQKRLAAAVTELVHGAHARAGAEAASSGFTRPVDVLDDGDFEVLAGTIPTTSLAAGELIGTDLVDVADRVGLVASKSEARRLLAQHGLYVNDVAQRSSRPIVDDDLVHGRWLLLRKGKKARHLVVVT
jgi:tyrosyl-tRNA synthetase